MKYLYLLALAFLSPDLPAQSNAAVRLALVSQTREATTLADILTAKLSGNPKFHLVERDEIDKVYREQGMSVAQRDDLKLGRILGADGLLLVDIVATRQETNLTYRLVAVKPGVVLADGRFPWSPDMSTRWSDSVAVYLDSFASKLALLTQDAIPISLVNLRSAANSEASAQTERELKLLTIQRLSQEPQLFVLERQKLQLMGDEKSLNLDETAFWNGAYLLEGVVDQNGYSQDRLTINARLTRPRGGAPVPLEVAGSRTNLAEAVNQLAEKIIAALHVTPVTKAWDAADEAAQYFAEAQWALRWGDFKEAEMAADSAWALGKQDQECATARIKAYEGQLNFGYRSGEFTNPNNTNEVIQTVVEDAAPNPTWGLKLRGQDFNGTKSVSSVYAIRFPAPASIDAAAHALEIYHDFSRQAPEGLLRAATADNGNNSAWYDLGIEVLGTASSVLQSFNFVSEAQKPVGDKLAELRQTTRQVAEWISQSAPVRASYFVGDRLATYDDLATAMDENRNIFRCEVSWGCYWQEKPEDTIALYRELIGSPVYCYIHSDFWLRELQTPRLVAWNESDERRIPLLWSNFVAELDQSTNLLGRLEARALALADAGSDPEVAVAFTNLFQTIFENSETLVKNPVDVLYLGWRLDSLVDAKTSNGLVTDLRESLNRQFSSQYDPRLAELDKEYWDKTVPAAKLSAKFEAQKKYLQDCHPFEAMEFMQLFDSEKYSPTQASELYPLLAAYKSNLLAQVESAEGIRKSQLMAANGQIGMVEAEVKRGLHLPEAPPSTLPTRVPPKTHVVVTAIPPASSRAMAPEVITNVLTVNKCLSIPVEKLVVLDSSERISTSSRVTITAHHWQENKLLLDFEYELFIDILTENGWKDMRGESGVAIAMLDPATERWDVISCPEVGVLSQNENYHRTTLLHGSLFNCDGGQIRKYDFATGQWQTLKISDGNHYGLFAVNGRLYAANKNIILEISEDGNAARILASTRRLPPASRLDTQVWGTPTLFEGPNHSLRLSAGAKIFTLAGADWQEGPGAPPASFPPEIFPDGLLFRYDADALDPSPSIDFLCGTNRQAELYLRQVGKPFAVNFVPRQPPAEFASPRWQMPANPSLASLPAVVRQSELYLLVDHSQPRNVYGDLRSGGGIIGTTFLPRDGYQAALLGFSPGLPQPQKLFLNFTAADSCQPLTGHDPSVAGFPGPPPAWMAFAGQFLIFGLEIPRNSLPMRALLRTSVAGKAGVWLLPVSQLEAAQATQRQAQLDQQEQAEAATKLARQAWLAKYDLNHNGIIDPEEREAALDDTNFIEAELDAIDTNHNGWLDASELAYFDANHNKTLEPKELAGINLAQHLFAGRLLGKYAANGEGRLDRSEFNNLAAAVGWQSPTPGIPGSTPGNMAWAPHAFGSIFPDDDHDGYVDQAELESFLERQTRRGLRLPTLAFVSSRVGEQPLTSQLKFKVAVEYFWQKAGVVDQRTQTNTAQ
jgi:hypothetical protein